MKKIKCKKLVPAFLTAVFILGWLGRVCTVEAQEYFRIYTDVTNINTVKVTWDSVDGAKKYRVYRKEYKNRKWSKYKLLATLSKDATSYSDTSCMPDGEYVYKVCAYKRNGGSDKLLAKDDLWTSVSLGKPEWDDLMYYDECTPKRIDLRVTWEESYLNPEGFEVYRRPAGGVYKKIGSVEVPSNIKYDEYNEFDGILYKDRNVESGKTYFYKVRLYAHLDGKKICGPFSLPEKLSAVYRHGRFTAKLYSKRVADADEMIVSVKSNRYNGKLTMDQESFVLTTAEGLRELSSDDLDSDLEGDYADYDIEEAVKQSRILKIKEYSTDGKIYKPYVKSKVKITGGKRVYFKLVNADGGKIDLSGDSLALYTSGVRYHERGRSYLELNLETGKGTSYFAGGF